MALVSARICPDYCQEAVDQAVAACLLDVGAVELIKPGDKVLLKVNLLSAKSPDKAVTTHPAVVTALVRWFIQREAEVWVGDSSGGININPRDNNTARALVASGVAVAAEASGAKVLNFDTAGAVFVPGGQVLDQILVAKPVLEADLVVSVPKLKTHGLTLFTGAVKNMFGVIPGSAKAEYHRSLPALQSFSQGLVDVFSTARPGLALMDAIIGMEGTGPAAGTPRHRGLILASRDCVALDSCACTLIGCPPEQVLTTKYAAQRGLGQIKDFEVVGDPVEPLQFRLPPSGLSGAMAPHFTSFIVGLLAYLPGFDPEICTNCNICVASCPVHALNKSELVPTLDKSACIQCFCCHELCPRHAIDLVPRYPRVRWVMDWLSQRRRNKK
jgi:uncharacterized protein (DUF362 family)/Pyruvate/2-oxoacid:ferredoxin oxidoreductase delta subunit